MENVEALEKGKFLQDALKIIDKLAENNLADIDGTFTTDEFRSEELQDLIIEARRLKNNRWWKLT